MKYFSEKNKKRMIASFVEMVKIDSESFEEAKMAKYLEKEFKALGGKVVADNAHKKAKKGNTGNVIAKFDGDKTKKPFFLCSHMDTVMPGKGVKPIVKADRVTSDGTTILGADCKSGIAVIIEIIKILKEQKLKHPPLEVLITFGEETGMYGSKNLDYKLISAKHGLVLDSEYVGEFTVQAPGAYKFTATITGKTSHAGMAPEQGISAIKVAANAISAMKLGRIDSETTANVGVINGGTAMNIVPETCTLNGEARSHNAAKLEKQVKHMADCFKKAVAAAKITITEKTVKNGKTVKKVTKHAAKLDLDMRKEYPSLTIPKTTPIVKAVLAASKKVNVPVKTVAAGGGSDSNIFFGHGIVAPILGCGMMNPHTKNEYLDLKEFENCAKVVLQTLLDS